MCAKIAHQSPPESIQQQYVADGHLLVWAGMLIQLD
jgi:hypothetical protein